MDRHAAHEAATLIASLIGELMEDHVDVALSPGAAASGDWPQQLESAGADIADLARAIAVLGRRVEQV